MPLVLHAVTACWTLFQCAQGVQVRVSAAARPLCPNVCHAIHHVFHVPCVRAMAALLGLVAEFGAVVLCDLALLRCVVSRFLARLISQMYCL